jgi:hypothetical protein
MVPACSWLNFGVNFGTAHTPCGVDSLRDQIKSNQINLDRPLGMNLVRLMPVFPRWLYVYLPAI